MVSGYNSIKKLKKLLAVVLCAVMVSNNTLPVIAETNVSLEESETTIGSSEFDVEDIESESSEEIESLEEETQITEETKESELEIVESENTESEEEVEKESDASEPVNQEEPEQDETESDSSGEFTSQEESEQDETSESEITNAESTIIESSEDESFNIASDSEIKEEVVLDEVLELDISTPSELDLKVINISTPSELDLVMELATPSEIEERLIPNSFIPDDFVAPIVEDVDESDSLYGATNLPTKYDSRQHNNSSTGLSYIPPVRDQYPFGTCWAFSTLAMFEASLRVKGLVKNETESNLSEAALAYFAYGLENVTNNSTYKDTPGLEGHDFVKIKNGDFASRGGNQLLALLTASAYAGVVSENSDTSYSRLASYQGKETQYTLNKKYAFNSNNFLLENAYILNKANIDIVKQKIIDNGAVGISYWSDNVYMHKTGSEYYYYTNIYSATNHGIAIVGWDDSIPAERFWTDYNTARTSAKNPGGWLCRNSWGEDWALSNKGYFWISYEEPSLSSNIYAVDAIKADTYKYNYHYDTTGYVAATSQSATSADQGAFANVFKGPADKPHLLEAASIAINSTNTVLSIDVYVNNRMMDNPTDGTLKSTVTVERSTAGIYTIPLKDKVLLEKGSYFSIIVRGYSKNSNTKSLSIFYDTCATVQGTGEDAGNPISYYNAADVGQSFSSMYNTSIKSFYSWNDMNPYVMPITAYPNDKFGNNYRIKGLANPVETVKVSFDSDGADGTMNDIDVVSNVDTKLPQIAFTKKGYKFINWVDEDGNEYNDQATININKKLALIAVWEPIKYTIIYNANGGNITVSSVKKTYGTNVTLVTPTKLGHVFAGWYKESSLTNKYDGTGDITTNDNVSVNLYAKWNPVTYTIVYDLRGVSANVSNNITKTYLTNVTLSNPTNIPTGYKFIGWYKDANYKNQYTGKEDLTYSQSAIVNIYAKWTVRLTYNSNGKGTSPNAVDIVKGESVMLPSIGGVTGYTFAGWYKDAGCNVKANDAGYYYKVNAPETIYAKWDAVAVTPDPVNPNPVNPNPVNPNPVTPKPSTPSPVKPNQGGGSSSGGGTSGGGGGGVRVSSNTVTNDFGPNSDTALNNTEELNKKPEEEKKPNSDNRVKTEISIDRSVTDVYQSSSAEWVSNETNGKWKLNIKDANGNIIHPANGFIQLDSIKIIEENNQKKEIKASDTYFFDENGDMVTGWVQTYADKWYYFNTEDNAEIGKMAFGWKKIDGDWYYFALEGALYRNTTTPDGCVVDENGKWIQ